MMWLCCSPSVMKREFWWCATEQDDRHTVLHTFHFSFLEYVCRNNCLVCHDVCAQQFLVANTFISHAHCTIEVFCCENIFSHHTKLSKHLLLHSKRATGVRTWLRLIRTVCGGECKTFKILTHHKIVCIGETVKAAQVLSSTIIISRTSSISSSCESIFAVIIFTFLSWRAAFCYFLRVIIKGERSVKRKIEKKCWTFQ